jgi:uncharacterized phage protein (TIGR01671 family)
MKEIKFRAWSVPLNRMIHDPYIGKERDQINDVFNGKLNKFIWMQYIGLKDKNDKEIYEGDILQQFNFDKSKYKTYTIKQQMYESCGCCASIYGWEIEHPKSEEIIGNIYENPDLLVNE